MYQQSDIKALMSETVRISLAPEFKNRIKTLIDDFDNVSFVRAEIDLVSIYITRDIHFQNVKSIMPTSSAIDFKQASVSNVQANSSSFDSSDITVQRRNVRLLYKLQRRKPTSEELPIFKWKYVLHYPADKYNFHQRILLRKEKLFQERDPREFRE